MPNENLNLVPAIRAIEEQISELNSEYVKKITPYKESLAKLKEINKAATIVGTRTYGKGVMQEIQPLFDGAIKITIEAVFESSNSSVASISQSGNSFYLTISEASINYGDKEFYEVTIRSYGRKTRFNIWFVSV